MKRSSVRNPPFPSVMLENTQRQTGEQESKHTQNYNKLPWLSFYSFFEPHQFI